MAGFTNEKLIKKFREAQGEAEGEGEREEASCRAGRPSSGRPTVSQARSEHLRHHGVLSTLHMLIISSSQQRSHFKNKDTCAQEA